MRGVDLYQSALVTVRDCLALKPGEQFVVVTDTMQPLSVAEALLAAARGMGAEAVVVVMAPRKGRGADLPRPVTEAIKQANVLALYSAPSIAASAAVREARKQGARVAGLLLSDGNKAETLQPSFIEDSFVRGVNEETLVNAERTRKISQLVEAATTVRITAPIGTDITMRQANKISVLDGMAREPGQYGQLPVGTFAVAPAPKSANGKFVVDISIPPLGILSEPIYFEVKDSVITDIAGGPAALQLKRHLESFKDPTVFNCPAEWGFGTGTRLSVSGNFLEEERIDGWAHIALGDDVRFDGGKVKSPVHLDGVMRDTSLELDDRLIIERGQFLI